MWGNRRDLKYGGKTIDVPCIRLDCFIEKFNVTEFKIEKIDFLHIDAQGKDLSVLRSLGKYINIVERGTCEVAANADVSIYKNQESLLSNTTLWIAEHGFEINHVRPNDQRSNEMNIFFTRVDEVF
jgi:hypothetical protein